MNYDNFMSIKFLAKSENESFARATAAAFISQLDPTVPELTEIKTAVSEAVTNAVIHAYSDDNHYIYMDCGINKDTVYITIKDEGKGINNIEQALSIGYTSKPEEERAGMGFTIMKNFMDDVTVESKTGDGTKVTMKKRLNV